MIPAYVPGDWRFLHRAIADRWVPPLAEVQRHTPLYLLVLGERMCYFTKKRATMTRLVRFGVSIDSSLLKKFDAFTAKAGYVGRSEAFRDLIRARLVEEEIQDSDALVYGVFTMVYNHHKRQLEEHLTNVQHDHHQNVITTTHVHVDHDNCLEVILLKGTVTILKQIALSLSSMKGVQHTKLTLTSTQEHNHEHDLPSHHHH